MINSVHAKKKAAATHDEASRKLSALQEYLKNLGTLVIAFSGGVDSTFLVKVAHDVLGERCIAVTACSETYSSRERKEAVVLAQQFGFPHRVIDTSELAIPSFTENPPDRCYHCKTELFKTLRDIAKAEGFEHVADGSTADDISDFRPGRRAAAEQHVCSPLLEVGLGKEEIRLLSSDMGLPTWNKPSFACLASRIPYNDPITQEKLRQVDLAEEHLLGLGIHQCRVRHHGPVARIEVSADDFSRITSELRQGIISRFRSIGFSYVTLDLSGYRSGSMNEVLNDNEMAKQP
ncbi:ATP-dependent sacrificial sulfur transferase LarE [Verrucomicrobiota bacterium]